MSSRLSYQYLVYGSQALPLVHDRQKQPSPRRFPEHVSIEKRNTDHRRGVEYLEQVKPFQPHAILTRKSSPIIIILIVILYLVIPRAKFSAQPPEKKKLTRENAKLFEAPY